jgi:hypothetical protein
MLIQYMHVIMQHYQPVECPVVGKTTITDISEIMEINCGQKRRKIATMCSLKPPTGSGGDIEHSFKPHKTRH